MKKNFNGLISIIVPVYNPPLKKFHRCIQSILQQLYKNIEVIIIDDGSNLATQNLLCNLKNDNRIQIYHQKNAGVSVARNKGIKKAKGEYISFVDADDYIDKKWIINSLKYLNNKYDVIFGRVLMCNEQTLDETMRNSYKLMSQSYSHDSLIEVQKMLLLNTAFSPLPNLPYLDLGPCGKLYKTNVIKNIKFPIDISIGEDQVFNHIVINHCNNVIITNYKAYYYIENKNSVGHSFKEDALEMMMRALKIIYAELISKDKELNEFYYSVILNGLVALALELTNNKIQNLKLISSIYKNSIFPLSDAIHNIKIKKIPGAKSKLRAIMFKYHLIYLIALRSY